MKKTYESPRMEKLEFNYTDAIVASNNQSNYNDDPNGQYYKCTGESYYAAGWGKNC